MEGQEQAGLKRPVFRELSTAPSPIHVFDALFKEWCADEPPATGREVQDEPPALLYSGMDPSDLGRHSFIALHPFARIVTRGRDIELADRSGSERPTVDPLNALGSLLYRYRADKVPGLPPFQGGAVGYIAYELNRFIENVPVNNPDDLQVPDIYFVLYDTVIAYDHNTGRAFVISTGFVDNAEKTVRSLTERLEAMTPGTPPWRPTFPPPPEPSDPPETLLATCAPSAGDPHILTTEDYGRRVNICQEHLFAGDIYEVNFTHRISRPYSGDAWELFKETARINPAPFSAFIDHGDFWVVSASPERFFLKSDNQMACRPMKGTRMRGATPEEDEALKKDLAASIKDRAENLMICDLIRNDLGRICRIGSVQVPELMVVETYATVHQMVSNIVGELEDDKDIVDCLSALFPGGSMTGAPKISAMCIIDDTENVARGVYSGCIGYIGLDGDVDMNIVIRTIILRNGRAYVNTGGAIVADSTVKGEHEESLLKAKALLQAMANLEGV